MATCQGALIVFGFKRRATRLSSSLFGVRLLPSPDSNPGFIKEPLIVALKDFFACVCAKQSPHRSVLIVSPKILLLIRRRHLVGAEQEPVRMPFDQLCSDAG